MRRFIGGVVVVGVIGAAGFLYITRPRAADADVLAGLTPDLARGEEVFHAGGCAACHASEDDETLLEGGLALESPFGTFHAPNISPGPDGIGGWSALDLYNAMHNGTSPEGRHYYPAFPYASYVNATPADIVSLHAYMETLPVSDAPSLPHELGFPFNIRASLGGWKALFLQKGWVIDPGDLSETETRGRYLVEALGHCGECHTPRNALGGMQTGKWLAGAPNPAGKGRIPNITPGALDWSEGDIAEYLSSGFTPDFDSVGGHMAKVVEETSKLPPEDRAAIAAYLKRVPPIPN